MIRSLEQLYLGNNLLNGSIPVSLAQLQELVILDSSYKLTTRCCFRYSSCQIDKTEGALSSNRLTSNISTWLPPFQLTHIDLRSSSLGPQFPYWLQKREELNNIDISNAKNLNTVPDWFLNVILKILLFEYISQPDKR